MQVNAYITVNGSKPTHTMLSYAFEKAKVADLCAYAAEKTFCPPSSCFKVSLKSVADPGNPVFYSVPPEVDLQDKAEMFLVIDPPAGDDDSFHVAPASSSFRAYLPKSPSTSGFSQPMMDTSQKSFGGAEGSSTHAAPTTSTLPSPSGDATFMQQVNALVQPSTPFAAPSSTLLQVPHNNLLLSFYFSHQEEVDEAYKAMKPEEDVLINKVDAFAFFDHPARKTALFVLKDPRAHMELIAASKFVSKKVLVELLVKAYPEYSCPTTACRPAASFLANATGNSWFKELKTSDGSCLIYNAFKKRKERFRQAESPRAPTTPAKRRKLIEHHVPEDLEAATVALASCSTSKEIKMIVANTAQLRCSWIKDMENENVVQIPEAFMKKFPCFISDASLLHDDYKCNMQLRGLRVADFTDAFKKFIPAIFKLASIKKILSSDTPCPAESDAEALLACKLLIRLVPFYCKRHKNCTPERLFAEGWDSTYVSALHQVRRDIKQPAPMIFLIAQYPSQNKKYFVATDDFALKVKGTFCDALQSLMELHYIFDLAYAKEMKPFFLLLEKLASLEPRRSFSSLNDLYHDLIMHADSVAEERAHRTVPAPEASSEPVIPENKTSQPDPSEEDAITFG